ncbi:MAG: RHS repeat-associated core domain-containing protein [Pseudomonadota bacterium]
MKDAKDQERIYEYDDLGRLVKRTDGLIRDTNGTIIDSGIDSVFTYYTDKTLDNGFSRMKSHQQNPGANGPKVEYFYDSLGRIDQTDTTISTFSGFPVAGTFIVEQDYDSVGQLNTITYPDSTHSATPFGVKYEYENGVVKRVSNKDNMNVWYYQLKSRDVWGGIEKTQYGNGVTNTRTRDEASSRVSDIESENGGTKFRDYSYVWDKVGNLEKRTRHMTGSMTADLVENFKYDSRYRLTEAKVGTCAGNAPECLLQLDYFDNGNIKKKTNLGDTYLYETAGTNGGPHAVTEIKDGGDVVQTFDYDDNGNMIYRGSPTNTISWTSFDKPSQIKRGSNAASNLYYDANYQRYRQVETLFNENAETLYIGGLFERHTSILQANSLPVVGYRHYIFANGERIATLSDIEATENTDGDSIVDASDNCTLVDNENQRDTNGDGFGNICDPDLNNDGAVNFLDTSIYLTHHLTQLGDPNYNEHADFNGDGAINYVDFALFPTYFSLGHPGPGRSAELGRHVQYFHTDHLGSIDAITDSNGELVAEFNYDAFGLRRMADTWEYDNVSLPEGLDWETTTRGFTDHEHLRELNLIHMNGRVYDPVVGRMISADPFIPHPIDSQSFNRYSYVQNNPLSRIDPTGYTDSNNLEETLTTATPDAPGGIESPPGSLGQLSQGGSRGSRGGNNSSGEPGTDFGQSSSGSHEGNSQETPGPVEEIIVIAKPNKGFSSMRHAAYAAIAAILGTGLSDRFEFAALIYEKDGSFHITDLITQYDDGQVDIATLLKQYSEETIVGFVHNHTDDLPLSGPENTGSFSLNLSVGVDPSTGANESTFHGTSAIPGNRGDISVANDLGISVFMVNATRNVFQHPDPTQGGN